MPEDSRLPLPMTSSLPSPKQRKLLAPEPVLLIVEGGHDISFLQGMSRMLHRHDARLPDLYA